jgi:hypothetical protein
VGQETLSYVPLALVTYLWFVVLHRSGQTLFSWFCVADVSKRAVPTMAQMQSALVIMGDKPASFEGSRDWIGSFEVLLLLDHFLGITCKIYTKRGDSPGSLKVLRRLFRMRHLASVSEDCTPLLPQALAETLQEHFLHQGTPVMAGDTGGHGGAITVLGVRLVGGQVRAWSLVSLRRSQAAR